MVRRRLNASNAIYYQHKKEVEKEFMDALLEPDVSQEFGVPEPDMFRADEEEEDAKADKPQGSRRGRGQGGDGSGF